MCSYCVVWAGSGWPATQTQTINDDETIFAYEVIQ